VYAGLTRSIDWSGHGLLHRVLVSLTTLPSTATANSSHTRSTICCAPNGCRRSALGKVTVGLEELAMLIIFFLYGGQKKEHPTNDSVDCRTFTSIIRWLKCICVKLWLR